MTLNVEATYENGVLKPAQPLPLEEHAKVRIIVQQSTHPSPKPIEEPENLVDGSYGLLGWSGDAATLRRLATDPELDPQESA